MRQPILTSLTVSLLLCSICSAQTPLWTRQIGSSASDSVRGVALDNADNVYITGGTGGNLGGASVGNVFLLKYDASGTLLWTRQFGSSATDITGGVAVDNAGNSYIAGHTNGSLGGPNAGDYDVFLAKYSTSGTLLWTRQFGTPARETTRGVAVDGAGNAYISGYTEGSLGGPNAGSADAFLSKFDASGALLWTRQVGTPTIEFGEGVAVDSAGNAYLCGSTHGSLGGPNAGRSDVFLAKYDASGTQFWLSQAGSSMEENSMFMGVAVDGAGNAYISGTTRGDFGGPSAGFTDVYLVKFDASGTLLWTRQAGGSNEDFAGGVAVDNAGNAYITGQNFMSIFGPSLGGLDFFLAKYDASGAQLWAFQAGTSTHDIGWGVAVDGANDVYISGSTMGSLGGPNAGSYDVFLAKYGDAACYADCDTSTGSGVLDVFDFLCFQNSFVNAEPYACDCDTTTGNGVCDVFDFLCFQDAFVSGCL